MGRRSKACEFPKEVRKRIKERDKSCIFCQRMGYSGFPATQIMHYVARSQGGKGIEQNGAWGCALHHKQLDNGMESTIMKEYFKEYLEDMYPDWNVKDLVFDKWSYLKKKNEGDSEDESI